MNKLIFNRTNVNWRYKWILWVCVFSLGIINFGCCKDEETGTDEYYVKYEVNSSTIYLGGKLNVELNAENNQNISLQINTRSEWETVIGPVNKGFQASLKVSEAGNNYGHLMLYSQISVSKNGSPFALKVIDDSDVPRTSVEIMYRIDY
ncbi:MAG: hypothetical protein R3A50_09800 [Saprospiraceae bacterium]